MSSGAGDQHPPQGTHRLSGVAAAAAADRASRRPRCNLRWLLVSLAALAVTTRLGWLNNSHARKDVDIISFRARGDGGAAAAAWGVGDSRPSGDGGGAAAGGVGVDSRPRVAVCFFGLTRSLRWTEPSVRRRLLGVLEREGMMVDVFVHTYSLAEVNNERAGERGVEYEAFVNDFQVLQPNRSLVTNQDDFDLIWPDPLSLTHYDWIYPAEGAGDIIRNVMRAYWSMSLVWGLMAQHAVDRGFEYDAVVLARPDVWFHYDVDLSRGMFPLPERTVFLPSFDNDDLKKMRRNDRFAYGSVATMRVVMNRMATLLEAGAGQYRGDIDSEWVLGHHLQKNRISVHMLDLLVTRVRLTRDIPKYDKRIVTEACRSGSDPVACDIMRGGFKFPADGAPAGG